MALLTPYSYLPVAGVGVGSFVEQKVSGNHTEVRSLYFEAFLEVVFGYLN